MKISDILKQYPQVLDTLVAQSPDFQKLRNPVFRRTFAHLVTLDQAAKMGKVDARKLLETLNHALGDEVALPPVHPTAQVAVPREASRTPEPVWLKTARIAVTLDVCEDQKRGEEPFGKIMSAVAKVSDGEVFLLKNTFEPEPLYTVLGKRGFVSWAREVGADDWEIYFFKATAPQSKITTAAKVDAPGNRGQPRVLTVDNRGLEPPEPMRRILELVPQMGDDDILVATNDRKPIFLFPQLDERGFEYNVEEQADGSIKIVIQKKKQ
jgi:uncharacterized protein (DUF2249 family)